MRDFIQNNAHTLKTIYQIGLLVFGGLLVIGSFAILVTGKDENKEQTTTKVRAGQILALLLGVFIIYHALTGRH